MGATGVSPVQFKSELARYCSRRSLCVCAATNGCTRNGSIDPCIANDPGRSPVPWRDPLESRISYARINSTANEQAPDRSALARRQWHPATTHQTRCDRPLVRPVSWVRRVSPVACDGKNNGKLVLVPVAGDRANQVLGDRANQVFPSRTRLKFQPFAGILAVSGNRDHRSRLYI